MLVFKLIMGTFFYTTSLENQLTAHLMVSGYRSLLTLATPGVLHARITK
jgi:hypothetical protein